MKVQAGWIEDEALATLGPDILALAEDEDDDWEDEDWDEEDDEDWDEDDEDWDDDDEEDWDEDEWEEGEEDDDFESRRRPPRRGWD